MWGGYEFLEGEWSHRVRGKVDVFDPRLEEWSTESTLGTPPAGISYCCASKDHYLYVYGTTKALPDLTHLQGRHRYLCSLYRLDVGTLTWSLLTEHTRTACEKTSRYDNIMAWFGDMLLLLELFGVPGQDYGTACSSSSQELSLYNLEKGTITS